MEPLWSPGVATDGNGSQLAPPPKAQKQAKIVAAGCHRLPRAAHGKERVCHLLPPVAAVPLSEKEGVDFLAPQTSSPANPKAHRTRPGDSDRPRFERQARDARGASILQALLVELVRLVTSFDLPVTRASNNTAPTRGRRRRAERAV